MRQSKAPPKSLGRQRKLPVRLSRDLTELTTPQPKDFALYKGHLTVKTAETRGAKFRNPTPIISLLRTSKELTTAYL
jgi:hypothetical protein